jgi:Cof subfamily protein (haloacid dehalogenase superfamily)
MTRYSILAFDCDGTFLTDDGEVLESTKSALGECSRRGIKIAFASGRAKEGIENVIDKIHADNLIDYYVCHNGARIYDADGGRYLADRHLTMANAAELLGLARDAGLGFYAFADGRILSMGDDMYANEEAEKNGVPVIPMEGTDASTTIYKFVIPGDVGELDRLQSSLPSGVRSRYGVVRSADTNLEFLHPDASKGSGIRMLCDATGNAVSSVLPFGDAENDLSMYNVTGNMVAMGNAQDCLKEVATFVTDDNNHDGIAKAIHELVLG